MTLPIDPVATMPVSALLGLVFVERSASEAVLELPLRAELLQGQGRVHGGILATLADTAAVWLLLPQVAEGHTLTSIEFKLNFVRPAVLERGPVRALAKLVRRGRAVALADVELSQQGQIVAKGLFTYLQPELDERGGV
jgi:uncharacterized protein (TIGR00369 family)